MCNIYSRPRLHLQARAKDTIEKLQTEIEKLPGDLGAHGAEIQQLQKDLASECGGTERGTDVRDEENAKFKEDKTENEQCLVALEQAIKLMTGAGAGSRASRL